MNEVRTIGRNLVDSEFPYKPDKEASYPTLRNYGTLLLVLLPHTPTPLSRPSNTELYLESCSLLDIGFKTDKSFQQC